MGFLHLQFRTDDPDQIELSKRYWELDAAGNFVHKMSLLSTEERCSSRSLTTKVAQYCEAVSEEIECASCHTPLVFTSRSAFDKREQWLHSPWTCERCNGIARAQEEAARLALEEQKRDKIRSIFPASHRQASDPYAGSLEELVALIAFIRLGASEDLQSIRSYRDLPSRFSPTERYDIELLRKLFQGKWIWIHPESPVDAFTDDELKRFFIDAVSWLPPVGVGGTDPRLWIAELESIFQEGAWKAAWYDEWLPLWKKLALEECVEYLDVVMKEHGLPFKPGDKTILVFNTVLTNFSVAQAYNMIWRSAKDAAAFYMRERIAKQHAANTVIGSVQRYAEHAISEGWEVKPYRRDFRCPESMVSQVFFNAVLHIGAKGFDVPPTDKSGVEPPGMTRQ